MEDIFTDISAFRLYRTPPAVLALFDELPIANDQATRRSLTKQPLANYVLGSPLHVIETSRTKCARAKSIKRHLWSNEMPQGAIKEIEGLGSFTSPEMTLLIMARRLSVAELALAMYEFCGWFTVYGLNSELKKMTYAAGTEYLNRQAGWQQVTDASGEGTNLWTRPPLISCAKLHEFADTCSRFHSGNKFKKAVSLVAGMTRSPLEAEAALLLTTPKKHGGHGFAFETNKRIMLSASARKIYQHDYCEADLYFESPDGEHIVDVECQGAIVHTGNIASVSDANRTTALETMGISVVQITYADIHSPERLGLIANHISRKLNIRRTPRSANARKAELHLRKELPMNWISLGL